MELVFDFGKVTIGDKKAFKRICGKNWTGYPWGEFRDIPAEDQAAIYYVVMRQNQPVSEDAIDDVIEADLVAVIEAMFRPDAEPDADPTPGSETSS